MPLLELDQKGWQGGFVAALLGCFGGFAVDIDDKTSIVVVKPLTVTDSNPPPSSHNWDESLMLTDPLPLPSIDAITDHHVDDYYMLVLKSFLFAVFLIIVLFLYLRDSKEPDPDPFLSIDFIKKNRGVVTGPNDVVAPQDDPSNNEAFASSSDDDGVAAGCFGWMRLRRRKKKGVFEAVSPSPKSVCPRSGAVYVVPPLFRIMKLFRVRGFVEILPDHRVKIDVHVR